MQMATVLRVRQALILKFLALRNHQPHMVETAHSGVPAGEGFLVRKNGIDRASLSFNPR